MSILIDPKGNIYGDSSVLSEILFPVQTGTFNISEDAKTFIHQTLNESNVDNLFQFIPRKMDDFCRLEKKLIPTKASIFRNSITNDPQKRGKISETPHINEGDELHFFFDGTYRIYFNIKDQHFCLIVQAGNWLYIPKNIEHWIKATQDPHLIIVSYHCEPIDIFHTKVTYTDTIPQSFL